MEKYGARGGLVSGELGSDMLLRLEVRILTYFKVYSQP